MPDSYATLAGLYDLAYGDFDDDVVFYENLARAAEDPILELGVGTGRVAVPLARAGHRVVGIDLSLSMLERARANVAAAGLKRGRVELVEADMTSFSLNECFGFAFVAANTFQHLVSTADQRACARCLAAHLQAGAIVAISVRSPVSVSWEDTGPSPLLLDWTRTDAATGDLVMKLISSEADPATMTRHLTYVYDRVHDGAVQRSVFQTRMRYSTQAEIEALLQDAGLRVTHVYGDYDLSPVGQDTDNLIFVARAEKTG